MSNELFEIVGYSDDGSEAVFGYTTTEEAAKYLVIQVKEHTGWRDAHYMKVTVH
jgi:hypothetical protein